VKRLGNVLPEDGVGGRLPADFAPLLERAASEVDWAVPQLLAASAAELEAPCLRACAADCQWLFCDGCLCFQLPCLYLAAGRRCSWWSRTIR